MTEIKNAKTKTLTLENLLEEDIVQLEMLGERLVGNHKLQQQKGVIDAFSRGLTLLGIKDRVLKNVKGLKEVLRD